MIIISVLLPTKKPPQFLSKRISSGCSSMFAFIRLIILSTVLPRGQLLKEEIKGGKTQCMNTQWNPGTSPDSETWSTLRHQSVTGSKDVGGGAHHARLTGGAVKTIVFGTNVWNVRWTHEALHLSVIILLRSLRISMKTSPRDLEPLERPDHVDKRRVWDDA